HHQRADDPRAPPGVPPRTAVHAVATLAAPGGARRRHLPVPGRHAENPAELLPASEHYQRVSRSAMAPANGDCSISSSVAGSGIDQLDGSVVPGMFGRDSASTASSSVAVTIADGASESAE